MMEKKYGRFTRDVQDLELVIKSFNFLIFDFNKSFQTIK